QLLTQAADGHDTASQRDLTSHGDAGAHRDAGERAGDAGSHRHTSAGAVLLDELWEVNVDVGLLVELRLQAEGVGAAPDVAHRGLSALSPALLEQAGEHQLALAGHGRDLAVQDVAAVRRDRQAVGQAHLVLILFLTQAVLGDPEVLRHVRSFHAVRLVAPLLHHSQRYLAANPSELSLEVSHAGFLRVVVDHRADRSLTDGEVSLV